MELKRLEIAMRLRWRARDADMAVSDVIHLARGIEDELWAAVLDAYEGMWNEEYWEKGKTALARAMAKALELRASVEELIRKLKLMAEAYEASRQQA